MGTGEDFGGKMARDLIFFAIGITFGLWIGNNVGYSNGSINAYYATMAEVHRQCESKFPLLIVDEFFNCKSTGRFLNE